MLTLISLVTLIKLKSYSVEPEAFASPPPNTVPFINISFLITFSFVSTLSPIFTSVPPYTTEVLAPPYTLPYIVPPAILTVAFELFVLESPVAAALPPPNTLPVLGTCPPRVPTIVFPLTVTKVFPYTIAVLPLPPAYILPSTIAFFMLKLVLPVTIPSLPPPYTLVLIVPPFIYVLFQ